VSSSYSERLWAPAWVHLVVVVASFLLLAAVGLVASPDLWVAVAAGLVFALWMELLVVLSTWGRRIHRDGHWLRVGFGEKLDLRWVSSVEVVHGEETRLIRHRLVNGTPPPSGTTAVAALGGQAGLAVGQFALAWSTFRGLRTRAGRLCPAGVTDAVHAVSGGGATEEWLIASRDPEALAATIREGAAESRDELRSETEAEPELV
jgi:Protein of unknown function (DUF3093)